MIFIYAACSSPEQFSFNDSNFTQIEHSESTSNHETSSEQEPMGTLSSGITMIEFEPGEITLGLSDTDSDWDAAHTPHLVELTHHFEVSQTEVTQKQFEDYMGYNPHEIWMPSASLGCDNCPVHSVTWHEMLAFSNKMSEEHGLESCFECEGEGVDVQCTIPKNPYLCSGYRPPTEAEWEYAAKGYEDYVFPGSDDIDTIGWWEENSGMLLHEVAQRTPNGMGLYDMGGNIREFVLDWFAPYEEDSQINPFVYPDNGAYPAERGGSFACRRPELRVNRRNLVSGFDRDMHTGFRIVRVTK